VLKDWRSRVKSGFYTFSLSTSLDPHRRIWAWTAHGGEELGQTVKRGVGLEVGDDEQRRGPEERYRSEEIDVGVKSSSIDTTMLSGSRRRSLRRTDEEGIY